MPAPPLLQSGPPGAGHEAGEHAQKPSIRSARTGALPYKGVVRSRNGWVARIGHEREVRYLGYFATEEDAARAYDAAARELRGEFARLNFPDAA